MLTARDCSSDTSCPIPSGFLSYQTSPASNAFMLAAFAALIPINIFTGVRYKTPLYAVLATLGLLLEVVGHAGKILLRSNPASEGRFLLYMIGTLWGPTFISAAVYLVLPHVMVIYGEQFSLIHEPIYCNIVFVALDIFTLAFQSIGIALSATSDTELERHQGLNILLTGLALQLTSLALFLGGYWYFRLKLSHRRFIFDPTFSMVYLSSYFKKFLLCVQAASVLLLVRAAIRLAAFTGGLASGLVQSQIVSLVLDDTLVLVAAIILSVAPVGRAFGSSWAETAPFTLASDESDLPLRNWRPSTSQHRKKAISHPFPASPMIAQPYPRSYHSIYSQIPPPPLASPQDKRVYQRAPYEITPVQVVPYVPSEAGSPPLSGSMPADTPRRTPREAQKLVDPDALWS
ncbi:RTA1 like protein-domain-containing protein [Neurospora hispaniola]|uniref:RTA1 like protein-domain-containing protein n=1 Tax=Neurospora hispaniola TaxID=588809 RepID=A0AAJ0MRL1_9PEZI|nr:RTA1 like protein-domain-containing protein [Neurospora hispaniola]